MNLFIPKTSSIPAQGIWNGKDFISGVFLKRHRRDENVQAIKSQVEENNVFLDPEKWLLLIEAHGNRFGSPQENTYVHEITDEYGLNVEDPIVNPFTPNIAISSSVDKVNAATSVMITDYLLPNIEDLSRIQDLSNSDEIIRFSSEAVAESFNVSARSVRKQFSRLSFSNEERLKAEIGTVLKTRQRLIDKSNELSREQLESVLLNNQEPNLLIMTGGAHEEVFQPNFEISTSIGVSPLREQFGNKISSVSALAGPPDVWQFEQMIEKRNEEMKLDLIFSNSTPNWDDFLYLYEKFVSAKTKFPVMNIQAMAHVVERIIPKPLNCTYFDSGLVGVALLDSEKPGGFERFDYAMKTIMTLGFTNAPSPSKVLSNKSYFASKVLRFIIEKVGDSLPDTPKIITALLSAPNPQVRDEVAEALKKCSKQRWRSDESALWSIVNVLSIQGVQSRRKNVELAIVSADPRFLFVRDSSNKFIIYAGKDSDIENVLVECARENDPKIRSKAFLSIVSYLDEGHQIDNSEFDNVLIKGLENKDEFSALTLAYRFRHEKLNNQHIVPLLIKYFDNPEKTDEIISHYLETFGRLLPNQFINDQRLKHVSRKNLQHHNEDIRIRSSCVFALLIFYEKVPNITNQDIQTLFDLSKSDPNKLVRINCTYGLSLIAKKDMDLFTLEQLDELENFCVRNRFPDVAADYELKTIDETYETLGRFSALKDLAVLVELKGHPTKDSVEQLIRKKERYKETIGVLLSRIQEMHEANQKLERKISQLQGQNQDLTQEIKELKEVMENLVKDLEKYKMLLKTKHVNKLLWSVGGTAARNLFKGRGIMHAEFAKSVAIDGAMDQLPDFINWLRGLN